MVHLHSFLSKNSLLDYLQELQLVGDDVVAIATHCHFDHSGGLHNFPEVIYQELSCISTEHIVHPCPSKVVQVWVHKKESKNVKEGKKQ